MASNPQQTTKEHLQFLYPLSKQHLANLKEYGPLEQERKCLCKACYNTQTLQYVVSACEVRLEEGGYTWRPFCVEDYSRMFVISQEQHWTTGCIKKTESNL